MAGRLIAADFADPARLARDVLAADLALLCDIDVQIGVAEDRVAALLPDTDYRVLTCALARRANKIAYAMVRDQTLFAPTRWS